MQIEGIPEGWELVRVGTPNVDSEMVLGHDGSARRIENQTSGKNYVIIRKIEKPKRYRPFANAAEFAPHRERWIKYFSPFRSDVSLYRITCYNDERVWLGPDNAGKTFAEAMDQLKFDDGTPFGVEVTE